MPQGSLKGVKIAGIVSALPQLKDDLSGYSGIFGAENVEKFSKMTGVRSRYISAKSETSADLCFSAAEKLLNDLGWARSSVDVLIFVSQTPDYRLPATALVLHGRLGLGTGCAAFDVNLGCSGYVYGLYIAASLMQSGTAGRILLLCGDTINKLVSEEDKSCAMLFGDAGSATALIRDDGMSDIEYDFRSDGTGFSNIMVSAGGFKNPYGDTERREREDGCIRSDYELFLDGGNVFNFTISDVPETINSLLDRSGVCRDKIDYYFLHQANLFMLKTIAKKINVPMSKIPVSIDRFGNTSVASIPLGICDFAVNLKSIQGRATLLLAGFGVGLSWGAMIVALDTNIPLEIIGGGNP